ncbi:MAG: DUF1565 domain-containing protein [Clostridia bacterium]|nr:DUF1565 domain-containing protein [Clostridia bacterium]
MNKRIICTILSVVMMLTSVSALAGLTPPTYIFPYEYLPGELEHVVTAEECIETQNAVKTEEGVEIGPGGSATWGFFLPFHARSLTIAYTGGGNITITTTDNNYNPIKLEDGAEKEYFLEFGVNLGYDKEPQWRTWFPDYGFMRDFAEHSGEKEITITTDEGVVIKELRWGREKTAGPNKETDPEAYTIKFSDDENVESFCQETINTILIHEDAHIFVANGGRRYVDNNNVSQTPQYIGGSLYMPMNTLAKALHYYNEEIPEKNYALMRSETHEVVLLDGQCVVTEGLGDPVPAPENVIIYHDGKYWGAIRYFAELMGKTVAYDNGMIVIDDKYTVAKVLNYDIFNNFAKEKFNGFTSAPERNGVTYHVAQSTAANDMNSGSALAPFKTISRAAAVAQPGDTVIVHGGTYRETVTPANSGEPNAPITYKAAEGERVIISATEPLKQPAVHDAEKGIYVFPMNVDMGDGRNQIFVDGEALPEARYPNGPEHVSDGRLHPEFGVRADIWKLPGDRSAFAVGGVEWEKKATAKQKEERSAVTFEQVRTIYDSVNYDTFVSDTLLDQEDDYWEGATYVGVFAMAYALQTAKIVSSTKGSITVDKDLRNQRWWWTHWANRYSMGNSQSNWNFGMIIGHYNAIDMPGEWSKKNDENRMYMMLPEGKTPETIKAEAKARQLIANLKDKKFINFEGFETIGGSIVMDGSEMCMLNNMNMKYISHYTLESTAMDGYIDFPYNNLEPGAPQRGEVGIYISGKDNIVVNSVIDHSAGATLYMTGISTYVENNIMRNTSYMGSYVGGIHINTVYWDHKTKPRGAHAIYNNTVYNSGRHLISFEKMEERSDRKNEPNHRGASFLGSDVWYNDFHDSSLQTMDVGGVYCNGVNVGFDRKFTDVSHNYVYKTMTKEDPNEYESLIYWDGNAHGFDTHNNIVFTTNNIYMRFYNYQDVMGNEAYCRSWNNQILRTISLDPNLPVADALRDEYFSEDKPFYAGSYLERETPYLKNYNRFINGQYSMKYRAKDAEVSEGVTIGSDGYAVFTEDGQWIRFKDVDFGDGANEILLNFRGDAYHTFDEFDFIVGKSMEEGILYKQSIPMHDTPDFKQTCTSRFTIQPAYGKQDIWIRMTNYRSARIGGLNVTTRVLDEETDDYCHFIYAQKYNEAKSGSSGFMDGNKSGFTDDPSAMEVKGTWGGGVVRYRNQVITEEPGYFVMAAGSRDHWLGQKTRVYLCEPTEEFKKPTGEYVAEFTTLNQTFDDLTPLRVPLLKDVKPGTYDLYIEFVYTPETLTSNIKYLGFLKKDASDEISSHTKYQGAKYDESITVEAPGQPLILDKKMSKKDTDLFMRVFTWPGTTIGYSNVNELVDCRSIEVCYSSDEGYANQPVTIRVVDFSGNEVARGSYVTQPVADRQFAIEKVKLNNIVPAGKYKVFFDFGGDKGSRQTSRLGWFRFSQKAE